MRSSRAVAAAGAAVAGLLGVHPAAATPFAGTYRGVHVTFSVRGADAAAYNVDLVATQAVASTPREQALYLDVQRCTHGRCRTIEHASQPLPDGAVNISADMTTATLSTRVMGRSLTLSAATEYVDPYGQSVTHPGFGLYSLDGPSVRTSSDLNAPATVTVAASVQCRLVADIFTFQGIDMTGDDVRDPHHGTPFLPATMFTGRHRPSCAS